MPGMIVLRGEQPSGAGSFIHGSTAFAVLIIAAILLVAGCTTVRTTPTERSSIEQRVLIRSLERAAASMDATSLVGHVVRLQLFSLTRDQAFAREFLRVRLERRGLRISDGPSTM